MTNVYCEKCGQPYQWDGHFPVLCDKCKLEAEIADLRAVLRDCVDWIEAALKHPVFMEPLTFADAHKLLKPAHD